MNNIDEKVAMEKFACTMRNMMEGEEPALFPEEPDTPDTPDQGQSDAPVDPALLEKVCRLAGLPVSWAGRLHGSTVEEIAQDALALKKSLNAVERPTGLPMADPEGFGFHETKDPMKKFEESFQRAMGGREDFY